MTPEFVKSLKCRQVYMCGSQVTCEPPPEDTDEDWLALFYDEESMLQTIDRLCFEEEFECETTTYATTEFFSLRKDSLNLLMTASEDFYSRHRRATALCKLLNLKDKGERIALFQVILYDKEYEL